MKSSRFVTAKAVPHKNNTQIESCWTKREVWTSVLSNDKHLKTDNLKDITLHKADNLKVVYFMFIVG